MSSLPHSNESSGPRAGGAFLLVLLVLVTGAGLMAGVQHALAGEQMALRRERAGVALRGALLLGLQTSMRAWAGDEDPDVLHLGESWAELEDFVTDAGATVRVRFRDPGGAFDLNSLLLPEEMFPLIGPEDVLRELAAIHEMAYPDSEVRAFRETAGPLAVPEAFPVAWDGSGLAAELAALPPPPSGMHRINLNTASPALLNALTGGMAGGWVDTVVQMRESAPLRSAGPVLDRLPAEVAAVLSRAVDVKSDFLEVRISAEYDHTVRELMALLHRNEGGDVEVLLCRW